MIERASFTNFKSLRRVDVELGRFTVIVGPNGSGKTSILDGLYHLAQATKLPLVEVFNGVRAPPNLKSRSSTAPMRLALEGRFRGVTALEGEDVGAGIEVEVDCSDQTIWSARVRRRWGDETEETDETGGTGKLLSRAPFSPNTIELSGELGSARKLRLDVDVLAAPSYSHEETPRLAVDGAGLASVLADLASRAPDVFQAITSAARSVIPGLERIRTRRAQVIEREAQEIRIDDTPIKHGVDRAYWGQQIVLDFKGAPDVLAPLASEGTLLVIGLLTAIHTEPRPRVLLLDDIDKALHPRAQGELVTQLRAVQAMDPGLQIVATSHSPYLIDHVEPNEVLVAAVSPDGATACAPLTAHKDFERWKGTTQSGELWSFLGEDWVMQVRA